MKKIFLITGFAVLLSVSIAGKASASQNAGAAIIEAQAKNQWLFVMFYEKKDSFYKMMDEKIKAFKKDGMEKPLVYRAKMTDSKEAEAIAQYRVTGAPMPLLLVFAPNGAITGGYPKQITDEQLIKSFPDQLVLRILKPIQEGKIALVMFQNGATKFNRESSKAAEDFAKTQGLAGYVETIAADPDDVLSRDLIMQSGIKGAVTEATIVMIVPPGKIGGVYKGKTDKEKMMAGLKACSASSCKPGACGPKK